MEKQYYVYILSNQMNNVLYIGMTNDLKARVQQHKEKQNEGFTKKYNVNKLVHFEDGEDVSGAIFREKQLKAGSRLKKVQLIESINPYWRDLYDEI